MPDILRLYAPRVPAGAAPAEDDTVRRVQEWLRGRAMFRAVATEPEPEDWQQHWWMRHLLAPSATARNRALLGKALLDFVNHISGLTQEPGEPEPFADPWRVRFPLIAP